MKKYNESHDWAEAQNGVATVGISDYAQEELEEIVFVELPKVGQTVHANEETVVVESTKAAVDIYSPLTGEVIAINERLAKEPGLINSSPEEEGWLFKLRPTHPEDWEALMTQQEYQKFLEGM